MRFPRETIRPCFVSLPCTTGGRDARCADPEFAAANPELCGGGNAACADPDYRTSHLSECSDDPRCSDPSFAAANPSLCLNTPRLILKPEYSTREPLQSVQYKAYLLQYGIETELTEGVTFRVGDNTIAVIGAVSGNATALAVGITSVFAEYGALTASAQLEVITEGGCDARTNYFCLIIDRSKSAKGTFSASYATRLAFSKYVARAFVDSIDLSKDQVSVASFDTVGTEEIGFSSDSNDAQPTKDAITAITQGTGDTALVEGGLSKATEMFEAAGAPKTQRVYVLFTDGENNEGSDPIAYANELKASGAIVIIIGLRARFNAFRMLDIMATGGFFINALPSNQSGVALQLNGLKGYICSGQCEIPYTTVLGRPTLNYTGFANWDVIGGHVDLVGGNDGGEESFNFVPGHGLYVDGCGSFPPSDLGTIRTKASGGAAFTLNYTLNDDATGDAYSDGQAATVGAFPTPISIRCQYIDNDSVDGTSLLRSIGRGAVVRFYQVSDPTVSITFVVASIEDEIGNNAVLINLDLDSITDVSGVLAVGEVYALEVSGAVIVWAAKTYTLSILVAGNQREARSLDVTNIKAIGADGTTIEELDITVTDYAQDFTEYSMTFTPAGDQIGAGSIQVQQKSIPAGSTGVFGSLWDDIILNNDTDDLIVFNETFDTENSGHGTAECVPQGFTGYAFGYSPCPNYCLTEPVVAQVPDPNPLPDLEKATTVTIYSSTKTVTAECELSDDTSTATASATSDVSQMDADNQATALATAAANAALTCPTGDLININLSLTVDPVKTGAAALGDDDDFWNYVRLPILGGASSSPATLKWADGTQVEGTSADTYVAAANTPDGIFADEEDTGHTDAMMRRTGKIANFAADRQLIFVQLPAGTFDVYIYGHGLTDDAQLKVRQKVGGGAFSAFKTTDEGALWLGSFASPRNYVKFAGLVVANSTINIVLDFAAGSDGSCYVSGIQLVKVA